MVWLLLDVAILIILTSTQPSLKDIQRSEFKNRNKSEEPEKAKQFVQQAEDVLVEPETELAKKGINVENDVKKDLAPNPVKSDESSGKDSKGNAEKVQAAKEEDEEKPKKKYDVKKKNETPPIEQPKTFSK